MNHVERNNKKGILLSVFSAMCFGFTPTLAMTIYSGGCSPLTFNLLQLFIVLAFLFFFCHNLPRPRLSSKQKLMILLEGPLSLGATGMLLYSSYLYIPSSMATTIHFVYPAVVFLICALLFKDRVSHLKIGAVILCMVGVVLFSAPGETLDLTGFFLALLSGVCYAVHIVFMDRSGIEGIHPLVLQYYLHLTAVPILLIITVSTGNFQLPSTPVSWLMVGLCAPVMIAGKLFFQFGILMAGPQSAAIASTFEPLTSIVLGVLLFSEPLTAFTLLGIGFILTAVILLSIHPRPIPTAPAKPPQPALPEKESNPPG